MKNWGDEIGQSEEAYQPRVEIKGSRALRRTSLLQSPLYFNSPIGTIGDAPFKRKVHLAGTVELLEAFSKSSLLGWWSHKCGQIYSPAFSRFFSSQTQQTTEFFCCGLRPRTYHLTRRFYNSRFFLESFSPKNCTKYTLFETISYGDFLLLVTAQLPLAPGEIPSHAIPPCYLLLQTPETRHTQAFLQETLMQRHYQALSSLKTRLRKRCQ